MCTVPPADICLASTANICHVSAAGTCPVSTAQDHNNARVHLPCRSQGVFIFESPHSLACFWLTTAKAEPWEKCFYQKSSPHVMSVHSIYRKENKDLKKCFGRLDPKRKHEYFKSLRDAMPKDFNTVECRNRRNIL